MSQIFLVLFICFLTCSLNAKTKRRSHSRNSSAAVKSSPAKKASVTVASNKPGSHKGHGKPLVKVAQTWRNRQQSPSADRYREIQDALVTKGYLTSAPSGVWDNDSALALRRFQEDQNLEPSGRLNAISLIALGLGPRTEASARPSVQQFPAQQSPTQQSPAQQILTQ